MKEKLFGVNFQSPNNSYYYDANKNDIVTITKEMNDYLNGNIKYEQLPEIEKNILEEWKNEGYFRTSNIKIIEHPNTKRLEYFTNNRVEELILQVTQDCTLRCSYCAYTASADKKQRQHSKAIMPLEKAKQSVDFLLEHSCDSKEVSIGFYGGEPLLNFALINEVVEYSKKLFVGKKVHYTITTNATVFVEEQIRFLIDNDFDIIISLDGPKEIHNKNRKFANGEGSYDCVRRNIERLYHLYKEKGKDMFSINMVIDPSNDFDDISELFEDEIFREITVNSSIVDDIFSEDKTEYIENFVWKSQYQQFLAIAKYINIAEGIKFSPLEKQFFEELDETREEFFGGGQDIAEVTAPGGPCIPGKRRLFVDVSGKLFPCERVSETSEIMNIGNIEKGFEQDKLVNILNIGKLTEEKCKNCWAMRYCGICARAADNNTEFSKEMKLKKCMDTYASLAEKIKIFILLKERKSEYR